MDTATQAALARSAATPDIGEGATVWVLGPRGYVLHAQGTNGWTCMVERDHPASLAPQCYDPEGTRTIVPGVQRTEALRLAGMSYRDAAARVAAEYADGTLPRPIRPVLSYMLSRGQHLYATPEGPEVGPRKPHVMIYHPSFSEEALGLPEGGLGSVSSRGRSSRTWCSRWPIGRTAGRRGNDGGFGVGRSAAGPHGPINVVCEGDR